MSKTLTFLPDFDTDRLEFLKGKAEVYPHRSNWASQLGDACLRRLVYYRTEWDKQSPPPPFLQGIFETGKILEEIITRNINDIGQAAKPKFKLIETAQPLKDEFLEQYQIGGRPDRFLLVRGSNGDGTLGPKRDTVLGPAEIKTMSSLQYKKIISIEAMRESRWHKRYIDQLSIYTFGTSFDCGFFILVNKSNLYDYRVLPLPLDIGLIDELSGRAFEINEHVEAKSLPDKINDPDYCLDCAFAHICCPDYKSGGNFKAMDDPADLVAILEDLEKGKDAAKEYKSLERARDKILEPMKGQDALVGPFLIRWSKIEAVKKPSPGGPYSYFRKRIVRV